MKSLIIRFLIIILINSCAINNQTRKKITETKVEFNLDDIYRLDSWFQEYSEEITYSPESGTILNQNNEEIGQVELDSINKKWFQTLIKKFNVSVDFKNKIKSRMTDKPYALLGFYLTGSLAIEEMI